MAPAEASSSGPAVGDSCVVLKLVMVRKAESILSSVVGEIDAGTRVKVLELSQAPPEAGDPRRRAQVSVEGETGLEGWITVVTNSGQALVGTEQQKKQGYPKASIADVKPGTELETLHLLPIREGEALTSRYLGQAPPRSRLKVLELGPASDECPRRALVSSSDDGNGQVSVQGWVSLTASSGGLLARPLDAKQAGKRSSLSASAIAFHKGRAAQASALLELARSGELEKFKEVAEAHTSLVRNPAVNEPNSNAGEEPNSPSRRVGNTLITECSDIRGRTPLMYAAHFGRTPIVDYLLGKGEVYINALDDTQKTALHHAAKQQQAAVVKMLVASGGAMLEARDHNGCTALMFAAGAGDTATIQVLLDEHAEVNPRDYEGNTALSFAREFGHDKVAAMLVAAGATDLQEDAKEAKVDEEAKRTANKKRTYLRQTSSALFKENIEETAAVEVAVQLQEPGLSDEELRRAAAQARLKAVMDEGGAVRDLEAALEAANQAEVKDEELLSSAAKRLEQHKECSRAHDQLLAAMAELQENAPRGREGLQGLQEALRRAEEKGVPEAELQRGKQVLDEELPRAEARQQLRDAAEKSNVGALRDAIAAAKQAKLAGQEIQPFEELLRGAESKEAAEAALKKAAEARDVAALRFALQQAKEAGVDAKAVAEAEEVLKEEAPRQEARELLAAQLAQVTGAGDAGPSPEELSGLQSAIGKAKSVSLQPTEYAEAEAVLAQEQKKAECKQEVAKALDEVKDVSLESMEALQEAKVLLNKVVSAAKAAGVPEVALREAEGRRRRLHNAYEDLKGSIRVFCRVRPINQREKDLKDTEVTEYNDSMTLTVRKPPSGSIIHEPEPFNFDAVFNPGTQAEVFEDCKDLVQSALDGYNVTVFAYGQTGAGKTYTMYGSGTGEGEGTAPRTIRELYRLIERDHDRVQFTVMASMMELYRNELVDLLATRGPAKRATTMSTMSRMSSAAPAEQKLNVRVDKAGAVQIEHLREEECPTAEVLTKLLERGNEKRTVAATQMNSESSRSHLLVNIRIVSVNRQTDQQRKGKILLCDLAGSERLKKSEATGDMQKEAIEINKSLTALGDVIEALVKSAPHVPYKNHKLTQVMSDALGGTSKTLMFVNCSPAGSNLEETLMTLKFATRAKMITNDVKKKMATMKTKSAASLPAPTTPT